MEKNTRDLTKKPKALAVTEGNAPKIQLLLDQLQAKSNASILDAEDILRIAEKAEFALEKAEICKRERAGAQYSESPDGPDCRAYKYTRLGTSINLMRRSRHWELVNAQRIKTYPAQRGKSVLSLTDKQKITVLSKVMSKYAISSSLIANLHKGS